MRLLPSRLRNVMIMIAFVALILTVIMQQVFLQRAQVRQELYRAIAEAERADTEWRYHRVQDELDRAKELLKEIAPK
jgi:cell division protein FtsL